MFRFTRFEHYLSLSKHERRRVAWCAMSVVRTMATCGAPLSPVVAASNPVLMAVAILRGIERGDSVLVERPDGTITLREIEKTVLH